MEVSGWSFLFQFGEDLEEAVAGFGFEDDGFGEQVVFDRVAGRVIFALGRDRSAGPGSVGTGGLGLTFGTHAILLLHGERRILAKFGSILLISGQI
jgi:hypothetical protein